jgi:hypothetical protein
MDITAANATLTLSIAVLLPIPVKVEGFSTDTMFTADATDLHETLMGADGKMSSGVIFVPEPFKLKLQADSPTIRQLLRVRELTKVSRKVYTIGITVNIPSIGGTWAYRAGVLQNCPAIPSAAKILQPLEFGFMFESCTGVGV